MLFIVYFRLYKERKSQIKWKLEELHEGTALEYRQPLQELEDNMNIRLEVANVLRQLRLENININYEAEEQAAKQNFEVCSYTADLSKI